MNDFSKPPLQSSVLDQFDLDQFDLGQAEQSEPKQHQEKKSANIQPGTIQASASIQPPTTVQTPASSQTKVIAISAIPVIDTPLKISSRDMDALDIPILTTLYSSHEADSAVGKTAQPRVYPGQGSKAS